jgi:hypothetical protein
MFIPFPANVEIYIEMLLGLVEFRSLQPDSILSLYDKDLTLTILISGKTNAMKAMYKESMVDSLSLYVLIFVVVVVVIIIMLVIAVFVKKFEAMIFEFLKN